MGALHEDPAPNDHGTGSTEGPIRTIPRISARKVNNPAYPPPGTLFRREGIARVRSQRIGALLRSHVQLQNSFRRSPFNFGMIALAIEINGLPAPYLH
jgi:hypothetical protein